MSALIKSIRSAKFSILLLLAAAIWGYGTVCVKSAVSEVDPFWLVGIRFFSAGVVLCIVFAPSIVKACKSGRLRRYLGVSAILGAVMIFAYMTNALGITDTTAANSSFLTALYCVLVPFMAWGFMRKRPSVYNVVAAIICVLGVGLVSFAGQQSFTLRWGDAVTLGSAVLFGLQITLTSKLADGIDMKAATPIMFLIGGSIAFACAAMVSEPPAIEVFYDMDMIATLVYLVLFATCAALLLQNIGLSKVAPASGSLLLSFESVFGVIFSVICLGEILTPTMVFGFALIFAALVVSEWLPSSAFARRLRVSRIRRPLLRMLARIRNRMRRARLSAE